MDGHLTSLLLLLLAAPAAGEVADGMLARRIRDGDAEALRAFFDRHHGLLYGYLRRRGVPVDVAEDLVQNAFIRIWERRAEIEPERSLRAYLFKIAYHRALNHFRDAAKLDHDADAEHASTLAAPDQLAEHALLRERLDEAVAALPERRRAVFELCFMQGLTYAEASDVLGVSRKTVENQMGRALKAIRISLQIFIE